MKTRSRTVRREAWAIGLSLLTQAMICQSSRADELFKFKELVKISDFGVPDILMSSAAIIQSGSDLVASIDQQFDATGTDRTRHPVGDGNFAYITQDGARHEARLTQTGNLNHVLVDQKGQGNSVKAEQIGNGNVLKVTQDGVDNVLTSLQVGDRNKVDVEQIGAGYRADVTIYGNDNRANVFQPEHGLSVTVTLGTPEAPVNGLTVKGSYYSPPR